MTRPHDTLMTLALVALVFTGPAALAAWVFNRDAAMPDRPPAAPTDEPQAPAAAQPARVLSGVLYTRGSATVDWNGVKIPVHDGSYAYLGGEVISTSPDAMGVLELAGGNRIYICPSSRVSLGRAPQGTYRLSVSEGTSRYIFAPGTDFRVHANRGLVTRRGEAAAGAVVGEITVFDGHPGGVICDFDGAVNVAGFASGTAESPVALGSAAPGEIVDLARALRAEHAASGTPVLMRPIPMPAQVMAWLRRNARRSASGAYTGYLCRCEELKRYAEAEGIPDTAIAPRLEPPESREQPLPDAEPSADPTAPPSVAVVEPGAPLPPDPAVLPPPGAGPDGSGLTVPPPAVPVGGSGGGLTTTPS